VTWLYQRVTIPNYEALATELQLTYSVLKHTNRGIKHNPLYINLGAHDVLPLSPLLSSFLNTFGLLNRFWYCIYTVPHVTISNKVHIDSPNGTVKYSLNLPLVDCDGTYTAFYAANSPLALSASGRILIAPPGMVQEEVDRVECSTPMFINVNTPHMGVSTRLTRLLMCLRFTPELTHQEVLHLCSILKFVD
jgi:hypothetical protein